MMTYFRSTTRACLVACVAAGFLACADTGDQRVLTPYDEDAGTTDAGDLDTGDLDTAPDDDTGNNDVHGDDVDIEPDADDGNSETNDENGLCQPVGDGLIRRSEFPLEVGASAPYKFGLDVPVDTVGEDVGGTRTWDLSVTYEGEFVDDLKVEDPDDYWFGPEFPDATYAAPLSQGDDDELGIFELTDDALLMIGVASPDDGFYRTELTYDPAVKILSFPLEEDHTWQTVTEASGSYGGNHAHSHDETYTSKVDAAGDLITPYGTFPVLRVNTHLLQEVWMGWYISTTELRTLTYVTECFGTVARIGSEEDEEDEEFDHAAEVMRLAQ